ncbi:MAG: Short-chain dehydrogenase/reductase [Mucilaginibacter sp.]|nr:Short-chain dehydrogenase/reductase [Mucilaginibacter sp.]
MYIGFVYLNIPLDPSGLNVFYSKTDRFRDIKPIQWPPAKNVKHSVGIITQPERMATYSTPDQIAAIVYEAATDGKDQLRYVAGEDAKATYALRLQLGDEAFRNGMDEQFFG